MPLSVLPIRVVAFALAQDTFSPLSRAGMMLTEIVFHFSKRKGEELEADHDPLLLPKTSIFSTESRALHPVNGDSWRLKIAASLSSSPQSLPAETREVKMLC